MDDTSTAARSSVRLFGAHALVSLVPVLAVGAVLASSYRVEARDRGLAEGRAQAALVAQTAVEPILVEATTDVDHLMPEQLAALQRLTSTSLASGSIVRLRVRDLAGRVVFSDDGSGTRSAPEDEALEAAKGEVVARTTHLNADANDNGPTRTAVVEVYRPLRTPGSTAPAGVLELYLPYQPIRAHIASGLRHLYLALDAGLAVLWVALFLLSVSVTRGLRRAARRNAHLAEHDPLTGLANRRRFTRDAEAAVARGAAVLAIFDLDRFKEINDTLGHRTGDRLLQELADRLVAAAPAGCSVARLGGDEFGVIVDDGSGDDAHVAILRMLRAALGKDVHLDGLTLAVEASVGFVRSPVHGTDADELMARADVAMYAAKARHGGIVEYDPSFDDYDAANLGLVAALRTGIEEGQLLLHYQPKTDLSTGELVSVEALVRWQHPDLGLLSPDRFLPLAEQTDLMDPLTLAVLAAALRDARDIGLLDRGISVAVNISARNLSRPEFASEVVEILSSAEVPAPLLTLEITETALLADPDRAAVVLGQLAGAGVRISIDDFGAGQTSLGYLSALPVHELKIDRSFVSDMRTNGRHDAIVRSITELAHNLSMSVVAEGVETADVLAGLADASCDVAQGYFIARPMAADRLAQWVAARAVPAPLA